MTVTILGKQGGTALKGYMLVKLKPPLPAGTGEPLRDLSRKTPK